MARIIPIYCGTVYCYILSGENGAVLVDTGLKQYRDRVLQKALEYNVRCILLTHGHWDHIQNAAYLSKELNIPIFMNQKDVLLSKDNRLYPMQPLGFKGKLLSLLTKISFRGAGGGAANFKSEPLEDEQSLERWGISACVLALPGHTRGSVGILVDETQLIAGDALMNFFAPSTALIAEDPEQAMKTVQALKASGIQMIYPGHGKPFPPNKIPSYGL